MAHVKLYDDSYSSLCNIPWDFESIETDELSSIHPYPARFIPEIPRNLIETLGCPSGCRIIDPFCGSGTTLVEAQRHGIPSVGIDLNPIAALISRVKTTPLNNTFLDTAYKIVDKAHSSFVGIDTLPMIPNLDHWFKQDIQKAISSLLLEIEAFQSTDLYDPLRLALSSIIVRVSNQESDTRYAAVDNNYKAVDVFDSYINSCKRLQKAKESSSSLLTTTNIILQDVLTVTPNQLGKNVGLVITSPPYPNAYEYWLYHKYRMWWLGFDPISVRTYEIGARPHYQKKNGQTEIDFYNQMNTVFSLLNSVMVRNAHVCFVVGRSIIKGREIDNAALITDIATKHNIIIKADIIREISPQKKSFNLKYGKIKNENILIFRKE